jgi:predicted Holliday junction resolvase-like endonuclease
VNALLQTICGLQEVLAICPCCGKLFRLIDAKFLFPEISPKSCDYLELVALEKALGNQNETLSAAEQDFLDKIKEQHERLVRRGRRRAKSKLKKIDPTFSGKNIDPQDVSVIFHPVEYIIFHGLNSSAGAEGLEFLSREPESAHEEVMAKSIEATISKGDVHFETLYMKDDGSFEIEEA